MGVAAAKTLPLDKATHPTVTKRHKVFHKLPVYCGEHGSTADLVYGSWW